MTVIHMETEAVQKTSQQLQQTNAAMTDVVNGLRSQVQAVAWEGPSADGFRAGFDALSRELVNVLEQAQVLGQRLEREVQEWLAADGQGGSSFRGAGGALFAMTPLAGAVLMGTTAEVLGVSTSNQYMVEYQQMSWNDKFQAEKELAAEIAATEKQLAEMRTTDDLQKEISSLDAEIAELEKQKAALQEQADKWYNELIPDIPPGLDSDGVPWRVRADDYEDQVAELNGRIQTLQAKKQSVQNVLAERQNLEMNVAELKASQSALSQVINQGVSPDGPTKPTGLKNQLAGCTNYVAEKRSVSDFPSNSGQPGHPGDACQWDDQARRAGYEVGTRPAKGAIMVFEPQNSVMSVDKQAGHVAYVESVTKVNGGYEVTISHANTQYDKSGNFIRGTHTPPRTQKIFVKDNSRGVSFVYDK